MTREYGAATVHTGQSDPIINRLGPKHSNATSRYGRMSSGFQARQSASVTRPDTLQKRFGKDASPRIPRAQESKSPFLIGGFARWSSTKRCPGNQIGRASCRERV